jgi:hypothetical protein
MKVTIIAELIPSNNKEIEYVITDGSPNKNVLDNDPIYFSPLLQNYMQTAMLKITPIKDVANADTELLAKLVFPSAKLDLRVLFVP